MTAQPVEPDPEEEWTAYETALAGLAVAAVVETGRIVDRLVPPGLLVEEVPARVRGLLAAALARSWVGYRARGASLAAVYAAAWRSGSRGEVVAPLLPPPPSADVPRLRQAAETVLTRAAEMGVGEVEADPLDDGDDLSAELAEIERIRAAEEAAEQAETARLRRADEEAMAEQARADAEADGRAARDVADAQALDAAREARLDAQEAATEAQAAERDRTEAADLVRAEREARRVRREAQRARAERIARAEVAAAAHEALVASVEAAPEVVGWVRKLDPDPCERCVTWWRAGGDPRAASPVRPYSVPMKRHTGCQCVQRPVSRQEGDARGYTDQPEPRARNRRHDRRAKRADGTV